MSADTQDLLGEQFRQLLRAHCSIETVRALEAGGDAAPLWDELVRSGFLDALKAEDDDGAGLTLDAVYPLVEACGRHALPLPFGQTLFARALAGEAGIRLPDAPVVLAHALARTATTGELHCGPIAEAMTAQFALVQRAEEMLLLPVSAGQRDQGAAGTGMARLVWSETAVARPVARFAARHECLAVQATVLAAQLAGAATHVFETTLQYANDRSQFGRSIGKFQAIQHQISVMAEHTALVRGAARIAFAQGRRFPDATQAAIAKSVTSESAAQIAAIAHAVHGAIGITAEYPLQLFTRRLHEWRLCAGSESFWNERLGSAMLGSGRGLVDFIRHASETVERQ